MGKQIIFLLLFLNQFNVGYSQQIMLNDIFNNIKQTSVIVQNEKQKEHITQSKIPLFDGYVFVSKDNNSDSVNSVVLIKSQKIIGALWGSQYSNYYTNFMLHTNNTYLPKFAQSLNADGIINYARFFTERKNTVTVGDFNNDNKLDYACYDIGNGLISLIAFDNNYINPTSFLLYDVMELKYIGIITFKSNTKKRIAYKGYVLSDNNTWKVFDLSSGTPVFLNTISNVDSLKKNLPTPDKSQINNSSSSKNQKPKNEKEFINLMKKNYGLTLKNWLYDYKPIINSSVIGTKFPKVN